MKRSISLILALILAFLSLPTNSIASQNTVDTILFDDGSYILIEITSIDTRALSTKTASKQYTYYSNSGDEEWRAVLTGTFTYDGTTSSCTGSSCSITITNTSWYEVSKATGISGNTATVDIVMGRKFLGITVSKRELSLSLTCDKDGNLS